MAKPLWHNSRAWRMRAEEVCTLAEEMIAPEAKVIMLRIAADYHRLAEQAEQAEQAQRAETANSN